MLCIVSDIQNLCWCLLGIIKKINIWSPRLLYQRIYVCHPGQISTGFVEQMPPCGSILFICELAPRCMVFFAQSFFLFRWSGIMVWMLPYDIDRILVLEIPLMFIWVYSAISSCTCSILTLLMDLSGELGMELVVEWLISSLKLNNPPLYCSQRRVAFNSTISICWCIQVADTSLLSSYAKLRSWYFGLQKQMYFLPRWHCCYCTDPIFTTHTVKALSVNHKYCSF